MTEDEITACCDEQKASDRCWLWLDSRVTRTKPDTYFQVYKGYDAVPKVMSQNIVGLGVFNLVTRA